MLSQFFKSDAKEWPSFIDSVEDFPHLRIVKLKGDLDATTLGGIQYFMKKSKGRPQVLDKSILLDLRKVERVDTATVAQLLKLFSDLKQKKYRLALMNVPESLLHMMKILKLEDVVTIFDSKKQAFSEIMAWSQDWK